MESRWFGFAKFHEGGDVNTFIFPLAQNSNHIFCQGIEREAREM